MRKPSVHVFGTLAALLVNNAFANATSHDNTPGSMCKPQSSGTSYDSMNSIGIRNTSGSAQSFVCPITHYSSWLAHPTGVDVFYVSSSSISCTVACTGLQTASVSWGATKTGPAGNPQGVSFAGAEVATCADALAVQNVFCTIPANAILIGASSTY